MLASFSRFGGLLVVAALMLAGTSHPSRAVPSFAAQTGQPCTACHVGAFGPQLTPLGRAFKIGGYTQTGGQGPLAAIPLAGFVQNSFTHTNAPQPQPAANDFGRNNNFAVDQVSLFFAGRISDFAGAFVQGTYDGVGKSFFLDNTDLRMTKMVPASDGNLRVGVSVNNGPTVQDPSTRRSRGSFRSRHPLSRQHRRRNRFWQAGSSAIRSGRRSTPGTTGVFTLRAACTTHMGARCSI
jgi:hypothetical protein